eukprot:g188.t1
MGVASSGDYAHLALELAAAVKSYGQLKAEAVEKKITGKEVAPNLPHKVVQDLNDDIQAKIAGAEGGFTLELLQDHLISVLPKIMVPRRSVRAPKRLTANPARLAEDGSRRARMWELFRETADLNATKYGCGITAAQATKQYRDVGCNPVVDESLPLPIEQIMPTLLEAFPAGEISKLDSPIGFNEFKGAVRRTRDGGKAADIHGLTGAMLKFYSDETLRLLLHDISEELKHKTLGEMTGEIHRCRDSCLFKGKGPISDPDGYRFLVISPRHRGCLESLLLFGRAREDLMHQRCDELYDLSCVLVDLRKAFPSTDSRLMASVASALGLSGTRCWRNILASHRSAVHQFQGGERFTLSHGTKEGCVSSPLIFILIYGPVMKLWRRRCEELGLVETKGIRLAANDDGWHQGRKARLEELVAMGAADRTVMLKDFLFADDTTVLTQLTKETTRAVAEESRRAKLEERAPLPTPAMEVLLSTLADAGMRENPKKREQGGIVELDVRNLGTYTQSDSDVQNKTNKAWRAFHKLKRLMGSVAKISNERKGELILVMVRPILTYGLVAKQLDDNEMRELEAVEMKMLAAVLGVPPWRRWKGEVTNSDLRRRAQIPPLKVHLKFLQARFLGHTLRRSKDDLPRVALVGHFFADPAVADAGPASHLVSAEDNKQYEAKARKIPDVLSSFNEHMDSCGATRELLSFLSMSLDELRGEKGDDAGQKQYAANKKAFHALTRRRFIIDTMKDWSRGDSEEDEEVADRLTIRYFGDKKNDMTRRKMREEAVVAGRDEWLVDVDHKPLVTGAESLVWGPSCQLCSQFVGGSETGARCDPVDEMRMTTQMGQHIMVNHPGAMEAHREAHGRGAYTWIYQVKGPDYRASDEWPDLQDKFRPEQHQWNTTTG